MLLLVACFPRSWGEKEDKERESGCFLLLVPNPVEERKPKCCFVSYVGEKRQKRRKKERRRRKKKRKKEPTTKQK
jgi:hypothetical protein